MESLDSDDEDDAAAILSSAVITLAFGFVDVAVVVDVDVTQDEKIATSRARMRCTKRSSKRATRCSRGLGGINETEPGMVRLVPEG